MKKVFSIFLSILTLLSSTGVAMTTHYCGGYAMEREITLGQSHLSCGMETPEETGCTSELPQIEEQGCCDNETLSAETEDYSVQQQKELSQEFTAVFLISYLQLYHQVARENVSYLHYTPPLLDQDVPILNQTFLL